MDGHQRSDLASSEIAVIRGQGKANKELRVPQIPLLLRPRRATGRAYASSAVARPSTKRLFYTSQSSRTQSLRTSLTASSSPSAWDLINTYATNTSNFPLILVTAITNIGTISTVAFDLVKGETPEGFNAVLQPVEKLRERSGAPRPVDVLTDKDERQRDALLDV